MVLEIAMKKKFTEAFTHINESNARVEGLEISLCAVLLAQACNTGLEPFVREDIPALKRDRLLWVDQYYIRDETLTAANAILVSFQNTIGLAQKWGGGDMAYADGIRFIVAVRTINAAPNPKYFPINGFIKAWESTGYRNYAYLTSGRQTHQSCQGYFGN